MKRAHAWTCSFCKNQPICWHQPQAGKLARTTHRWLGPPAALGHQQALGHLYPALPSKQFHCYILLTPMILTSLLTSPLPYKGGAAAWAKQNTPSMSHRLQTPSFSPGPPCRHPQFPQTSWTPRHPWALWVACWGDGVCGPGCGRARAGLWGGSLRDPARSRAWWPPPRSRGGV